MMLAGHSEEFRDLITTRAVAKYLNSLDNHLKYLDGSGGRRMYRTKEERADQRKREGGKASKADWFRKGGFTSVLNVPATQGSLLAKEVAKVLQEYTSPDGLRPRVQERPGRSVKCILTKSNPFPTDTCGRSLCPWNARGEKCQEKCYKESICYVAFCRQCRAETEEQESSQEHESSQEQEQESSQRVKEQAYIGETSRSIVSRIRSHVRDCKQVLTKVRARRGARAQTSSQASQASAASSQASQADPEETSSWMADHIVEAHEGRSSEEPLDDFEFHLLRRFLKPLDRQVAEAILIEIANNRGVIQIGPELRQVRKQLCNRKGELFHFNPRGRQPSQWRGRPPG